TRTFTASALALALQGASSAHATQVAAAAQAATATVEGSTIVTHDNVRLYYKDWGPKDGPVVTFSHGWPLNSDSWEAQMLFLASKGYRVVAHHRRGRGRPRRPWSGTGVGHYAAELGAVITGRGLRDGPVVGASTGGGEVARYIGRRGTARVKKAGRVAGVPPMMLGTGDNPDGLPIENF